MEDDQKTIAWRKANMIRNLVHEYGADVSTNTIQRCEYEYSVRFQNGIEINIVENVNHSWDICSIYDKTRGDSYYSSSSTSHDDLEKKENSNLSVGKLYEILVEYSKLP